MVWFQYWKNPTNTFYKIQETEEWQARRVNLNVLLEETAQFMESGKKKLIFSSVFNPINTTKNINNFLVISFYLWWKAPNSYSRTPQKHCHEDGLF